MPHVVLGRTPARLGCQAPFPCSPLPFASRLLRGSSLPFTFTLEMGAANTGISSGVDRCQRFVFPKPVGSFPLSPHACLQAEASGTAPSWGRKMKRDPMAEVTLVVREAPPPPRKQCSFFLRGVEKDPGTLRASPGRETEPSPKGRMEGLGRGRGRDQLLVCLRRSWFTPTVLGLPLIASLLTLKKGP